MRPLFFQFLALSLLFFSHPNVSFSNAAIDIKLLDYVLIEEDKTILMTLELQNNMKDITIQDITTSCDCVIANINEFNIPHKQKSLITITIEKIEEISNNYDIFIDLETPTQKRLTIKLDFPKTMLKKPIIKIDS